MSNDSKLSKQSFAELMKQLRELEHAIENQQLDDLDQLMSDVEQAEAIIDHLRERIKAAEQKLSDNSNE